jgi:cellulose synthase (UDP-forming)
MEKHERNIIEVKNLNVRLTGVLVIVITVWYFTWFLGVINKDALFISIPFILASIILAINTLLSIYNHWTLSKPQKNISPYGNEPLVGIIIPTYGEPVNMVMNTINSVLTQNWPNDRMVLVVSDDALNPQLRDAVLSLKKVYDAKIIYNTPPAKGSSERRGEAKAGNLNSAFEYICKKYPGIEFIETRDADDLVSDKNFLRQCIGQLTGKPELAFVQTIKEGIVSEGDPFGNQEPIFYRNTMPSKYTHNAAFSCGSGVVYRKFWLNLVGGFATWNLVEDLYTSYLILQKGGRGMFLPIVGALGQIAPEDVPNSYKQRGTWAIDAFRIIFWKNPILAKGLSLSQKIQFLEIGTFYMLGPAMIVFMIVIINSLLFGIYPVNTDLTNYALHFWPYLFSMELFIVVKANGLPYESIWRSRQTWMGLSWVFTYSMILALLYGPNKKPAYKVTRKYRVPGFYWRDTLPQMILTAGLVLGIVFQLYRFDLASTDFGSMFWAVFFILTLNTSISNAWYGTNQNPVAALSPRIYSYLPIFHSRSGTS